MFTDNHYNHNANDQVRNTVAQLLLDNCCILRISIYRSRTISPC